jgi:eukaryotic-like serine/threonine-protein kinase
MPLSPGTRLGPYEVISSLGAGGMGEVYRARDTRLNRHVALKVLPDLFAGDPERRARFEREAQLLAALTHSHIATIYGFEESNGISGLAMELVDGDTLFERLARGPLDTTQALEIARGLAEGLEYAHERGIIHRDLKPANIKIAADGSVKILDFGLAKALVDTPANPDLANSPTASVSGTRAGVLLGTAAYMAPEQARGQTMDRRTDIWAFGCVLYEMLAGRQAFAGTTVTDILAAIVSREPDWNALPPDAARIRPLLQRCLRKDPRERLRDIGDARIEIDEVLENPALPAPQGAPLSSAPARRSWLTGAVAGLLLGGAAVAAIAMLSQGTQLLDRLPTRLVATVPADGALQLGRGSSAILSPDGRQLAFSGAVGGVTRLFVRPLDHFESKALPGTEGATNPFFSPDGLWLGFFADGKLKKVALSGGQPVVLCDAAAPRGEAWSDDGTIFFTFSSGSGLWRVPASGGKPEPFTKPGQGELSHRWPQIIPGRSILYTVWNDTGFDTARIVAQKIAGGERRTIVEGGSYARYVPGERGGRGYLVYARMAGLIAAPFDAERLELTGPAVPVLDGIVTNLSGGAHFSVSAEGSLAYVAGGIAELERTLALVDRTGVATPLARIRGMSLFFEFSPDGKRLARSNPAGPNRDLWVHDLGRDVATRLTFIENSSYPIWTPDGRRITFSAGLPSPNLYWKAADGSGKEERLTTSAHSQFASSFSPDGKLLVYIEVGSSGPDLWILPLEGDRTPRPLLVTPFAETNAAVSPDGRWFAYESNESGRFEVYVQAFSSGGRKWQVSTNGGRWAKWSRDGKELFFRAQNSMMAAAVRAPSNAGGAPELEIDKPRMLFQGAYEEVYTVMPDGRFAVIQIETSQSAPTNIQIVLNWAEELRRRVR